MARKKAAPKVDETPAVEAPAVVEAPAPEPAAAIEAAPVEMVSIENLGSVQKQTLGDVPDSGETVIVTHGGQEHEGIVLGFTMAARVRLKDGKDTEVLAAHGAWRPK